MADMTSGAKAAFGAIKSHWGWFAVFFFGAIVVALWYDHKNSGDLTKKVAGLPVVGKLFA